MKDVNESEVRRLVREAVDRALGPGSTPSAGGSHTGPASPVPTAAASPATGPASAPARPAPSGERRVAIGSDHGGYALKEVLVRVLRDELGWDVHDLGTHSTDAVDYPDFAAAVAREVSAGRAARGIVVDAAGIGSSMAANKIPGVRCALAHDDVTAINAREHNDANVLALGARVVNRGLATRLVRLFLTTEFGGGRHARRVLKIMALEGGR
jgi:ribose 5-phosphate isomerase B